ncbi:MAG: hypothetical protein JWO16_275, partial [Sphingomonas bacterium]|nr:hypothetical protein [Sphingomonas bacterium]
LRKFFDIGDYVALRFYKAHPEKPPRPTRRSRYDAFMYRFSIACVLYFIDWLKEGAQLQKTAARLRNDMIDINFATYGTYFNGIMSDDKRVQKLQLELRVVLEAMGARMPKDYLEDFIRQLEAAPSGN